MNKYLSKVFLIILLVSVFFACYLIFKPFLIEIFAATVLVSIFYTPYSWLVKKMRGRKNLASLIMCLAIILVVIVPLVNLIVYGAQKSIEAYSETISYLNNDGFEGVIKNSTLKDSILSKLNLFGIGDGTIRETTIEAIKKSSNYITSGAAKIAKGTTSFVISLITIIFTMFFFFVDGKKMLEKLMYWTPLPNKYDKEIFKKFRDVSYSTMLSTFVTAIAQGLIGAIGFMIVGLPAFFAGVFMAIFSLIPYIGTAIIWLPVAIYLFIIGEIWQGVFLVIWGAGVVGTVDNLIKAYIIKGKAQVHPIFIIFSILGGISLFGFWGVILGPLIISLAVTILHIYEIEYGETLEK